MAGAGPTNCGKFMKKILIASISFFLVLLSVVPSMGQITGVELARSKQ